MKPGPRLPVLLLAAATSVVAHWAVLQGVQIPDLTQDTTADNSVMVAAILPPASDSGRAPVIPLAAPAKTSAPAEAPGAIHPQPIPDAPASTTPPPQELAAATPATPHSTDAPAASPPPMAHPQAGQLHFQVFMGDGDGEPLAAMVHTLSFQNGQYSISSRGEALGFLALLYSGMLTQNSSGHFDHQGFSTRAYSEQRGKKPESRSTVDADRLRVEFGNGQSDSIPTARLYDRLSVIYQLGQIIRDPAQAALPPPLTVLSSNNIETWQFVRVGSETLPIGDQGLPTVHYRRQPDAQEKTGIDLWYEKGHEGLPVQIRLTDKKGFVITQRRAASDFARP